MMLTLKEIADWAATLYEARTIEVAQDRSDVLSITPENRVGWHELCAHFPELREDVVNKRINFQEEFNKAIKKRGLWKVLQGKETASVWYEKLIKVKT